MIRQASVKDIAEIRKLAEVVFRATYRELLSPEQLEYMMDMMYSEKSLEKQLEEGVFFICDGQGYASVRPDGKTDDGRPRYHLEKLYVLPEYQKTGLGRRLFETVCTYVLESEQKPNNIALPSVGGKSARLELNVNRKNPSLGFYEHLGMRKDRSGDFPIGKGFYMNDFIMVIDL